MSTEAVIDLVDILNTAAQPVYDAGKAAGEREAELRVTNKLVHDYAAGCYDLAAMMIDNAHACAQSETSDRLLIFARLLLARTPDGSFAGQVLGVLGRRSSGDKQPTLADIKRAHDLCRERCEYFGGYHR